MIDLATTDRSDLPHQIDVGIGTDRDPRNRDAVLLHPCHQFTKAVGRRLAVGQHDHVLGRCFGFSQRKEPFLHRREKIRSTISGDACDSRCDM